MSESGPRALSPAARRTLYAVAATMLGVVPLKALFSDNGWLVDVGLAVLVVIVPALLVRLVRPAGALDIWPGVVLLVPWLTGRYVSEHAWFGVIPNRHTLHDVSLLLTDLHKTSTDNVAPIHTTVAVRLVLCALVGLLAALVDLIAVVGRRGALAGVPLLVVFTVAGAVPRKPVHWVWFAAAAAAYLILLAIDAGDDLATWGRRIRHGGSARNRTARAVSAQRIAVTAVVAALVLPLLVPSQAKNLLADAFHNGSSGGGGAGAISPFVKLKGQLDRRTPAPLANVTIEPSSINPFYLRTQVLSKVTATGWSVGDHGIAEPLGLTRFRTEPDSGTYRQIGLRATIEVTGLSDNVPVFAVPTTVSGVGGSTTWSPQDQVLLDSTVVRGERITQEFLQPDPSIAQLRFADPTPPEALRPMLVVPPGTPRFVRATVNRITRGLTGTYARARALNDYFTDSTNGFIYSLATKPGDSGSDLVDFLTNKQGYCQQFAAAMAIMLRMSGVPSRVVLGYMHPAPDKKGRFAITTSDAHSWVEAYFSGIGWVPFDPTPASGLVGGARTDIAWAPHSYPSNNTSPSNRVSSSAGIVRPAQKPTEKAAAAPAAKATTSSSITPGWWILLGVVVVVTLALIPALARNWRRRKRVRAARVDGDTDALWAELSDTAVDLGFVWSPARSPRQVADWLSRDVREAAGSLRTLAAAVEHRRYSPAAGDSAGDTTGQGADADLVGELRQVTGRLRGTRSLSSRARAWIWPASLGWGRRGSRRRSSSGPRQH